jgi:hypothetical protein
MPSGMTLRVVLYLTGDTIFYRVYCALLYIENDAEISPVRYTWKVAEKGFKMAFMMNKLAIINSCDIILEK